MKALAVTVKQNFFCPADFKSRHGILLRVKLKLCKVQSEGKFRGTLFSLFLLKPVLKDEFRFPVPEEPGQRKALQCCSSFLPTSDGPFRVSLQQAFRRG